MCNVLPAHIFQLYLLVGGLAGDWLMLWQETIQHYVFSKVLSLLGGYSGLCGTVVSTNYLSCKDIQYFTKVSFNTNFWEGLNQNCFLFMLYCCNLLIQSCVNWSLLSYVVIVSGSKIGSALPGQRTLADFLGLGWKKNTPVEFERFSFFDVCQPELRQSYNFEDMF